MTSLAAGIEFVDVQFLGFPSIIATAVLHGTSGVALIDPGPSTSLPNLRRALTHRGIDARDVTQILLTHIHLDHGGATGTLLRENPDIEVFVHERGAAHLVDPSKLVASAGRLYGQDMERLWGEILPVPAAAVRVLRGGERLVAGGRPLDVAYTPGHASHHVRYFDAASGVAFVGDTGGVCVDEGYALPPTPPPDIDVELWEQSIGVIGAWSPSTLFVTHCGVVTNVPTHLQALVENLKHSAALVRETLAMPGTDDERRARYEERMRAELRAHMPEERAAAYETAAGFGMMWAGLARYWRKREALRP